MLQAVKYIFIIIIFSLRYQEDKMLVMNSGNAVIYLPNN